jgi:signal transduction histidine kinase
MRLGCTCICLLIVGVGSSLTATTAAIGVDDAPNWSPWSPLAGVVLLVLVAIPVILLRIEQTKSRVRQHTAARTYERWRIARDLHDTLLPGVQSLLLRINIWADDPALPGELRAEIKVVWQQAREIVVESRDRIAMLRNGDDIDTDLFATLNAIANARSINEVPVLKVALRGHPQLLTNDAYHELADIAQEAIRNALQHANAQRILVTLEYAPRCLVLVIADDGCGLPSHLPQHSGAPAHYGILGMRERARYLNATFRLGSNDGGGTKVTICVSADIAFAERQGSGWSRVVTSLHRVMNSGSVFRVR